MSRHPHHRPHMTLLLLAAAWLGLAPLAAAESADEEELVRVEMGATTSEILPGSQFELTFRFRMEPHWHIYWRNPGDSGAPTQLRVEAPDGYDVGEVRWPRPTRITEEGYLTFGYEDEVVLFVPVTAPDDAAKGDIELTAHASWLVCKTVCVMGQEKLSLTLPLATNDSPEDATDEEPGHITKFRERLPAPVAGTEGAEIRFDGEQLWLSVPADDDEDSVSIVPDARPGVTFGQIVHQRIDDQHTFQINVELEPENSLGEPMVIAGLVLIGETLDDPHYEFAIPADK